MKPFHSIAEHPRGFTLVELIITIVAAGILGAFFIHFMGTALTRSSESVTMVINESGAEQVMERIIADYVQAINSDPGTALSTVTTNNSNGEYGPGVSMQYIGFDSGGNEFTSPPENNTLKVTVQAGESELTTILTLSRIDDPNLPLVTF